VSALEVAERVGGVGVVLLRLDDRMASEVDQTERTINEIGEFVDEDLRAADGFLTRVRGVVLR
jgi:hypothetical protein